MISEGGFHLKMERKQGRKHGNLTRAIGQGQNELGRGSKLGKGSNDLGRGSRGRLPTKSKCGTDRPTERQKQLNLPF